MSSFPPEGKPVNKAEVFIFRIDELENMQQQLFSCLNESEQTRFARFTCSPARSAFLVARAGLRLILAAYLNISPATIPIYLEERGKPYIDIKEQLHFNVSHSNNIVVAAFSDHQIGIDVEYCRRSIDFVPVMRRFFSSEEQQEWSRLDSSPAAFFRAWTRKEAFLKATGEGIAGLGKTIISLDPECIHALIKRTDDDYLSSEWFFRDFIPGKDYHASIAAKELHTGLTLHNVCRDDLRTILPV
jgi:4'-phosphopantetheinyl transferase